ncbi:MAG: hypothetical protein IIV11_02265 [Clostridia bacterium]|nr:hypothetical protein [Clostridia bacterium]
MRYNVFISNESLSITCDDKLIMSGITLSCSFSRLSDVIYVPSEIERDGNRISVSFKRKYRSTYVELKHGIVELEEVGSSLKVSLNALAGRYYFLAHGGAHLCFTMPEGTTGALALDSMVPCWMNVSFPKKMDDMQESVDSLAFKANGLDVHVLPLCNDNTASRVSKDGLKVSPRNNGAPEINSTVMCITAATDPYEAVHGSFVNMKDCGAITVPLAADRKYPAALEGLGWCTWEAFHHGLTTDKVLAKMDEFAAMGHVPSWVLLDDGWANYNDGKLVTLTEDTEKFPTGLIGLTTILKEKYGVKAVGVWCGMGGHWKGIDPEGEVMAQLGDCFFQSLSGIKPGPTEEQAFKFWDTWFTYLKAQGIDFVKVDVQGAQSGFYDVYYSGAAGTRAIHSALDRAAEKHFDGALINCMGAVMESALCRPSSFVNRTSYDFYPNRKFDLAFHTIQSIYTSTVHNEIHCCDFDMFFSKHDWGEASGAMAIMSGGPVYLSDNLGASDPEIISKLCLEGGDLVRYDVAAKPTVDCYYTDCSKAETALKLFSLAKENIGFMALGVTKDKSVRGSFKLSDLPRGVVKAEKYLLHDFVSGEYKLVDEKSALNFTLGYEDCVIYTLYPVAEDGMVSVGDPAYYCEGSMPAVKTAHYSEFID